MQLFNSLSKNLETFTPLEENKVVMYVCGLTPYDSAHIGHARTYVSFDVIKRYLIKKGYSVYHIQNITDVDDKIIKRCLETGADPTKLTTGIHDEAMELFGQLNISPADVYPKVTGHMEEIIAMVKTLLEKGHAYETDDGVYFDVLKFKDYGKLSGQDIEHMKAGVRKEVAKGKRSPLDFALWKKTQGEILEFDSPWGKGRPGWHIECSAMAKRYGKRTLDIHGGARDLIFPHHENEIAQSEAANDEKFCNYWLHTGFLTVSGEKMSKSLGNFITLKQALSSFTPNALRLFYLQAHYRSPLDYDGGKI
jgi:cysteinyl-tRNA synthetase